MKNKEELEKKTGVKRFDICIQNPPYGSKEQKNNRIHYKFVTKCNEIADRNIVVMPYKMIDATSNQYDDIKNEYDNILTSVEEVDANVFDIHVGSVGIYTFNNLKGNNNHITIYQKNGNVQTVKSLFEFNSRNINEYEQNILNYLDNHGNTNYYMIGSGSKHYRDKDLLLKSYKRKFNDDDILLLTNYSHGSGRPFVFMSPNTGQIFKAGEVENCEYAMKGYRSVLSKFKTFNEANNFKDALKRPLMRFGLSKLQDSQDMPKRVRQYIPDIDWSDYRSKTDEGILELCGCPKDKCKEYTEYCKKIIEEVDKY